jgi:hypothetical protein
MNPNPTVQALLNEYATAARELKTTARRSKEARQAYRSATTRHIAAFNRYQRARLAAAEHLPKDPS